MAFSSISVVTNANRLRNVSIHSDYLKKERPLTDIQARGNIT